MRFRPLLVLACCLPALAWSADLKLKDGTVLKNARVTKVEGAIVTVVHAGGELQVPLRKFDDGLQRELLNISLGLPPNAPASATPAPNPTPAPGTAASAVSGALKRPAAPAAKPASADEVVVTAPAIPLVEPYELTPEDARARRLFEDIAKKKRERDAKDAKTIWNAKVWKYVPPLISVGAEDPNKPSLLKWDLQPGSVETYGAPDPRTGK